jgi:hypothetical protein
VVGSGAIVPADELPSPQLMLAVKLAAVAPLIVLWKVPASPLKAIPAVGMMVFPVPEMLVILAVPLAVAVS